MGRNLNSLVCDSGPSALGQLLSSLIFSVSLSGHLGPSILPLWRALSGDTFLPLPPSLFPAKALLFLQGWLNASSVMKCYPPHLPGHLPLLPHRAVYKVCVWLCHWTLVFSREGTLASWFAGLSIRPWPLQKLEPWCKMWSEKCLFKSVDWK